MKLYEFIHKLFEATPQSIYKDYNDDIVAKLKNDKNNTITDGKPIVDALAKIAPTNAVNTYMLTLYRAWMDGLIDVSKNNERLHVGLTAFEKMRKNKKTTHTDPNRYTFSELKSEVAKAWRQQQEEERQKRERQAQRQAVIDSGEIKTIYEDSEIKLLQPTSFQACRSFGREGSWCVSKQERWWDDYSADGDFYILFIKRNPDKGIKKQKQFGIHIQRGEWQDEQNKRLPDDQIRKLATAFPKIKELLHDEAIQYQFVPLLDLDWYKSRPQRLSYHLFSETYKNASDEQIKQIKNMIKQMDDEWKNTFIKHMTPIHSGSVYWLSLLGLGDWYKTRPVSFAQYVGDEYAYKSDEQINKWKTMIEPMNHKWKTVFVNILSKFIDEPETDEILSKLGLA